VIHSLNSMNSTGHALHLLVSLQVRKFETSLAVDWKSEKSLDVRFVMEEIAESSTAR
jgi:hypothetical protein